jgi:hypothetical protein
LPHHVLEVLPAPAPTHYLVAATALASAATLSGGVSVAKSANALHSMATAKERIMLSGGVMASMAMSGETFDCFVAHNTTSSGVFDTGEDLSDVQGEAIIESGSYT